MIGVDGFVPSAKTLLHGAKEIPGLGAFCEVGLGVFSERGLDHFVRFPSGGVVIFIGEIGLGESERVEIEKVGAIATRKRKSLSCNGIRVRFQ